MTGHEYANLIAEYILRRFEARDIQIFREVPVGKSIIGKNRRIDIFVLSGAGSQAMAIECKYQGSQGTVDEKIPYALKDIEALPMPGLIAYAGEGFSRGVLHLLEADELSAYCLPKLGQQKASGATIELDHQLAMCFGWWDILVEGKKCFQLSSPQIAPNKQGTT